MGLPRIASRSYLGPSVRPRPADMLAAMTVAIGSAVLAVVVAPFSPVNLLLVVGVGLVAVFMLTSQRYELTLALLMLYLALLDGYVKLRLNTSWATLGRDVLLYAIVIGVLLRGAVRRKPVAIPPLTGWVVVFTAVVLVQVFNPRGGWSFNALAAVRPHIEFVPLFFLGYMVMRSKARLRSFLVLLLLVTAVNAVVAYVQFGLSPEQLAAWGPGYDERINGTGDVSGRTFVDDEGGLKTRPFALGADQGFGGFMGILAVPAAMALLLLPRRPVIKIFAPFLGAGVVLAIVTSQARVALVAAVVASLAFVLLSSTARRPAPTMVVLAVVLGVTMATVSLVTSDKDQTVFRRYDTVTPDRVVETTFSYRRDTLERIPDYVARFPLGAGLGSGGPGAGFIGSPATSASLNAESEPTYLLIELGVPGLLVLTLFNARMLALALTRIRRLRDLELRLLLAALLAPLFAIFATWIVGIASASSPAAPFFWFVSGIAAYWLTPVRAPLAALRPEQLVPSDPRHSEFVGPRVSRHSAPPPMGLERAPSPPEAQVVGMTILAYIDRETAVDGIRDYSQKLCTAMNQAGEPARLMLVHDSNDVRNLPSAAAIVLQYNPFSWGRWGVARGLVPALEAIRGRAAAPTVALMVHEPFMPFSGVRPALMGIVQRLQMARLRRAADITFVTIEPWIGRVNRWGPDGPVQLLPVGSNLPDKRGQRTSQRARLQVEDGGLVVALFGTDHPSRLTEYATRSIQALAGAGYRVTVLNLGAGAPALSGVWVPPVASVVAPGQLPPDAVAKLLSAADIFLAPFVDGVSTRRTTLMAALQHAVPVVGTSGKSTSKELKAAYDRLALVPADRPDLFVKAVLKLAAHPEERARLGAAGRQLYEERFDWPVIAETLGEGLRRHSRISDS